jgi:hypothetical protein
MPTIFEQQHPLDQGGFFRSDAMAQHGGPSRRSSDSQAKTEPPARPAAADRAPAGKPRSPRTRVGGP